MNFLSTGVKEVTRRVLRQKNRLALASARKVVEKAETELGRHGWRELAGDQTVRPEYETLLRLDETLAAAQARIAELERGIQAQEAHREEFRREHEATLGRLEAVRAPVQGELDDAQEAIAEYGKALPEQNSKRQALQAEQKALLREEKRTRWLQRSDSPAWAEAQKKFDERRGQLTEQAALLAVERSGLVEPILAGHQRIKAIRARLQDLDRQVGATNADLAGKEREAAVGVGERVREIAVTRRQAGRIEEEKDESYAVIGHRLAELSDVAAAPPEETPGKEGYDLFLTSRQQRQNYARLLDQDAALLQESRDADKQDLRVFVFVVVTMAVLILGACQLVFRTPGRHEWLPGNTQALVTVNVRDFTDADFTRMLQQREPDAWQAVWSGLVRKVDEVPQIDVRRQVARISRALAPGGRGEGPVDCLLVDFRASVDVDDLVRHRIAREDGFGMRLVGGLPMYEKPGVALAQIGPSTLALGSSASVEVLIRVRLGLPATAPGPVEAKALKGSEVLPGDQRTDAQIFSEFASLDDDRAYRLVAHSPQELTSLTDPLLNVALLPGCDALGLTLDMHQPMSAVIVLRTGSPAQAGEIARTLEATPDKVLQLQSEAPNLFIEKPNVATLHGDEVEWKFRMTEPAAKEFLQKVSRVGIAEPKRVAER